MKASQARHSSATFLYRLAADESLGSSVPSVREQRSNRAEVCKERSST